MVTTRAVLLAGALFSGFVLAAACAAQPTTELVRTPDQHPPPRAANGDVIGADNKSPAQTLAEEGTTGHPAPGWKIDKNGVAYDPKRTPTGPEPGATRIARPDGGTEVLPKSGE
jgi:hypothetical protein